MLHKFEGFPFGGKSIIEDLVQRDWRDDRIAELEAEVAEKDARIAELEKRLSVLEEQLGRNSSNSHQPPSSDSPEERRRRKNKAKKERQQRKRGGQQGHAGTHRELVPPDKVSKFAAVVVQRRDRRLTEFTPLRSLEAGNTVSVSAGRWRGRDLLA